MKLDGRVGCDGSVAGVVYGAGATAADLGDNGSRPQRPPTVATMTATTTANAATDTATQQDHERDGLTSPREPCDFNNANAHGHQLQLSATATTGSAVVPKTSSAVGSSLFTIDSILAPSRSSDAATAAAVTVAGRNTVSAATVAAAGFFKQPLNFGHLAAAAAASGYAHSTAANFLGKSTTQITIITY